MKRIQAQVVLGPIDTRLPGAMKLTLNLLGDEVISSSSEFGFLKRNILSRVVGKPFLEAQRLLSRVEPESALILDRIYSETVEKTLGWTVEGRSLWIREITTEVSELNGMLKYLAQMAQVLGLGILKNIILKHREELLDLIELLTGSRYGYYSVIPGGVRYGLTEGFIERMENWIKNYSRDLERIRALFLWTHSFQNRLRFLGRVLDQNDFGFVSEAAQETSHYGLVSHVESRLLYTLSKSTEACDALQELLSQNPKGEVFVEGWKKRIKSEAKTEILTWRGAWEMSISLEENLCIKGVQLKSPSDRIRLALADALEEEQFEDVPIILQSLNFLIPEIDQ